MDITQKISNYLDTEKYFSRTDEEIKRIIEGEKGEAYYSELMDFLDAKRRGAVDDRTFYNTLAEKRVVGQPLYDVFTSRMRSATEWHFAQAITHAPPEAKRILDIGSGTGLLACFIAQHIPHAMVEGWDRAKHMVYAARERAERLQVQNVRFREGSYQAMPVSPNYDFILCNHSFDEDENEGKEYERIEYLLSLLTQQGKLLLIRPGQIVPSGHRWIGETTISDPFSGFPPEHRFQFNDANGCGFTEGVTVWGK